MVSEFSIRRQKLYRCPKSDGDAKQTLEFRVERKRNNRRYVKSFNPLSASQLEYSFLKRVETWFDELEGECPSSKRAIWHGFCLFFAIENSLKRKR